MLLNINEKSTGFQFSHFALTILIFLPVFSSQIFFLVAGLVGVSYEGSDESPLFVYYSILVFSISLLSFAIFLLRRMILIKQFYFLLLVVAFLSLNLTLSFFSVYEFSVKELGHFLLLGLPGAFSGLIFYRLSFSLSFIRNVEYFSLIISYLFLITIVRIFLNIKNFTDLSLGGASYQFISYTACMLYGILLYLLYYRGANFRKVKGLLKVNLLYFPLLVSLPLVVFFTGSKGAAFLFVIYSVIFIFTFFLKNAKSLIVFSFFVVSVMLYFMQYINQVSVMLTGFNRIFLIFDSDSSIDDKASGRFEYYENFLYLIKESPLLGYGSFVENGYVTNSHNFFSMVLLNFGLVFGLFFIFFNIYLLISYIKRFKFSAILSGLILILLLFSVISLFFSGSYLKSPIYWFVSSVMFSALTFKNSKIYN